MKKKSMSKLTPPWLGSPEKKTWYEVRSPEASLTNLKEALCKGEQSQVSLKSPEDHRLKNWKKWMTVRKSEHSKLSSVLGRDPCNLTMNSEQFFRPKQEEREIIEYAHKLNIPDKTRGGLEYWGFPLEVGNECSEGPLFAQQSNIQKGLLPNIVKAGVPKIIKEEKDTRDVNRLLFKTSFENSKYKIQQEKSLKRKIDLLLPHKPDIEKLAVVGHRPTEPHYEPYIRLPVIAINLDDKPTEVHSEKVETLVENIMALRINNTILLKEPHLYAATYLRQLIEERYDERKTFWVLNFVSKPFEKITKCVTLQNMGTVAVKYAWRKIQTSVSYMKKRFSVPIFFFEKNENVLIPGEEKQIKFWYWTTRPQLNSESWELNTYPNFIDQSKKITFKLSGITIEDPLSIENLKSSINGQAALNIVEDIVDKIIETLTLEKVPEVSYEDVNNDGFIFSLKNHFYYYHQDGVNNLKKLYDKIPLTSGREEIPWDLSIKTLRGLIISTDFPEQTELFKDLREILPNLLKPNFQRPLFDNKYMIVYCMLGKFFNMFETEFKESEKMTSSSINAINSTHIGQDLNLRVSVKSQSIFSQAHNNEICRNIYGLPKDIFNKTVFERKVLRRLQLTIEQIDAILQM